MPIRPEFLHFYGKDWQKRVRPRILERAKDKCERCHKPNHVKVLTYTLPFGRMFYRIAAAGTAWVNQDGKPGIPWQHGAKGPPRVITVILTVAHLNHTPGDDRDENLKAWCQWCHLLYDRQHHKATRTTRKDSSRPLIEAVIEEQQRQEGAAYVCQEATTAPTHL